MPFASPVLYTPSPRRYGVARVVWLCGCVRALSGLVDGCNWQIKEMLRGVSAAVRGDATEAAELLQPPTGLPQPLLKAFVSMLHEGKSGALEAAMAMREALGLEPMLDYAVRA